MGYTTFHVDIPTKGIHFKVHKVGAVFFVKCDDKVCTEDAWLSSFGGKLLYGDEIVYIGESDFYY